MIYLLLKFQKLLILPLRLFVAQPFLALLHQESVFVGCLAILTPICHFAFLIWRTLAFASASASSCCRGVAGAADLLADDVIIGVPKLKVNRILTF
jgi:hypothetical protein